MLRYSFIHIFVLCYICLLTDQVLVKSLTKGSSLVQVQTKSESASHQRRRSLQYPLFKPCFACLDISGQFYIRRKTGLNKNRVITNLNKTAGLDLQSGFQYLQGTVKHPVYQVKSDCRSPAETVVIYMIKWSNGQMVKCSKRVK
jgi:hypothetical protein